MKPKQLQFKVFTLFSSALLIGLAQFSFALTLEGTDEEKGLAIATASKASGQGWGDSSSKMEMILRNAQGQESTRELRIKSLEVPTDGDKSLSIFDTPPDIRNTKMLTYSHNTKADEQWLFLPALKRVKRISSKSKSGPFMGSEFAFEDFSSFEVEKYTYKYLGEEVVDDEDCYKSEMYPSYKHSGYSKLIIWIDKAELRPLKTEYYDRKGALLKTQVAGHFKLYKEKFWRAHTNLMINHQTKKSTLLKWSDFTFGDGLKEADFHQNVLKRVL